jgi:GMP synthase-like glutamine amidotransferase
MKRRGDTVRYKAEEIDEMLARGESRTAWAAVKAMTEDELEASIAADPGPGGRLLRGLPRKFAVGRYHSLHTRRSTLPPALSITAETEDRVIMAIEHARLPIAAVQFHLESVMTAKNEVGMPIISSMLSALAPP